MKPSAVPPRIVDDPNQWNLTQEYLTDFVAMLGKYKADNEKNKSYTNITNGTFEERNPQQAANCEEYCNSEMRHFFDEYKQYHGYVALVVSTCNLINNFYAETRSSCFPRHLNELSS